MLFVVVALVTTLFVVVQVGDLHASALVEAVTLGVFAVLLIAVFAMRLPHERRSMMTYALQIDDDGVSRQQDPAPPLRIGRSEITQILETDAGVAVLATSPQRCLSIPTALEGYAEARETLATWRSIESTRKGHPEIVIGATSLLLMACGGASALTPWPWVILPSIVLWAAIAYGLRITLRSTQVPRTQKTWVTVAGVWFACTPVARLVLPLLQSFLDKLADWH